MAHRPRTSSPTVTPHRRCVQEHCQSLDRARASPASKLKSKRVAVWLSGCGVAVTLESAYIELHSFLALSHSKSEERAVLCDQNCEVSTSLAQPSARVCSDSYVMKETSARRKQGRYAALYTDSYIDVLVGPQRSCGSQDGLKNILGTHSMIKIRRVGLKNSKTVEKNTSGRQAGKTL